MDFAQARQNMVQSQIRPNSVTDPLVVAALSQIPRENFVPEPLKDVAYVDEALPIAEGRFLMEPMVLARLLQAAAVQPSDVALVIGAGTGYGAAVMSTMATTVVALECDGALAARASGTFSALDIDTVAVVEGSLNAGYPDQAPYDVILIEGAIASVPEVISAQLAEGGHLVVIVNGKGGAMGEGILMTRTENTLTQRSIFDASTPLLSGFEAAAAFSF